jgi:BirA family transcriptional regulator, biotin operon repressor / biotin---[acetyl-CoA-carboxylase] ligase
MNFTIVRFDSIDSTNTEAHKQARLGAGEGLCVIAREQNVGRGRQGRSWISPKDAGLYLSVVLRPKIEIQYLPLITLAAAVAVHEIVANIGLMPDIKWPNDVLINEKKICGILAEMTETDLGLAVVLGIGINITSENFSPEIADSPTSISAELKRPVTVSEVEKSLLPSIDHWYSRLQQPEGHSAIVDAWAARSTYFRGKKVRGALNGGPITGITDGLEPDGALHIKQANGSTITIHAGDVEQLRTEA